LAVIICLACILHVCVCYVYCLYIDTWKFSLGFLAVGQVEILTFVGYLFLAVGTSFR